MNQTSMSPFASLRNRPWLATLALLAFTARALIPVGFMPSGEGFFGLRFCPDGLSAQAFAILDPHAAHHHHADAGHDHRSWNSAHCAFAAVASAPPFEHSAGVILGTAIETDRSMAESVPVVDSHRFRIAQPRGPPASLA